LLAIRFRVRNRLLNIDFRLRWSVNGSHLSLCAVARFEVPERRMDTVRSTRYEPQHPVAPTLQAPRAWSVSKKYTLASTARHPQVSITATSSHHRVTWQLQHTKKEAAAVFRKRPPFCMILVFSAAFDTRFLHRSSSTRTNSNPNHRSWTPCRHIASS
jgi:hypothetical protein